MATHRKPRDTAAGRARFALAGLLVALALASCAAQPATNVLASSTPTVSPAPSISAEGADQELPVVMQESVAPPVSAEAAFAAADKTVNADQVIFFDFYQGRVSWASFAEFETGEQLELMKSFVSQSDGGVLSGEPDVWLSVYSASTASTLVVDGADYPFGLVHLRGCYEGRSDLTYPDSQGDTPPTTRGLYFPNDLIVQYDPSKRVWLITGAASLSDYVGQTECDVAPA